MRYWFISLYLFYRKSSCHNKLLFSRVQHWYLFICCIGATLWAAERTNGGFFIRNDVGQVKGRKECGCNLIRKWANSLVFTCKAGFGESELWQAGYICQWRLLELQGPFLKNQYFNHMLFPPFFCPWPGAVRFLTWEHAMCSWGCVVVIFLTHIEWQQ